MIGYVFAYVSVIVFAVCLGKAAARPAPHPPSPGDGQPTARTVGAPNTQVCCGRMGRARSTRLAGRNERRPGMSGPEAS